MKVFVIGRGITGKIYNKEKVPETERSQLDFRQKESAERLSLVVRTNHELINRAHPLIE